MRIIASIALAALCAACATITRSTTDQVQIQSDPPGAEAHTSMGHLCTTPCTLQFNRKDEFVVTISKPGYHTEEIPVVTRVAGAGFAGAAGNVLIGGVVGLTVDVASGATLEHIPNPVFVTLEPVKKGQSPQVHHHEPPPSAPPANAQPRT
jgi:hypothetical protein